MPPDIAGGDSTEFTVAGPAKYEGLLNLNLPEENPHCNRDQYALLCKKLELTAACLIIRRHVSTKWICDNCQFSPKEDSGDLHAALLMI